MIRLVFAILTLALVVCPAQDTRGSITGEVTDPQGAVIPGAAVVISNIDTNASNRTQTNQIGYFEANMLNPGAYSVAVEAAGFKRLVRVGLQLNVSGRVDVKLQLEIGQADQVVNVTAAAPLLDTATAAGGRVIANKDVTELPFTSMNPFALTALSAGMQWTGSPTALRAFDNAGVSAFNTSGGVGQNEYLIDGAPVTGTDRRVGFVPSSEAVEEFRLETSSFDASYGHTSGATVNVVTKGGTNTLHGSLYEQDWQSRWNATPHFTRLQWDADVAAGRKKSSDPKVASGRSNQFGGSVGGPVRIPRLFDGRDKLFFFVQYGGIYQRQVDELGLVHTVPKMAWRQGDFSDLLAIDAVKYTIYDPRSAFVANNRVTRLPFPGNKGVPILNPAYDWWSKLYPAPNDVPGLVSPDGTNNLFNGAQPSNNSYNTIVNRIDYNVNSRHRIYGKWYWNHRDGDSGDWAYQTPLRGLLSTGLIRVNKGFSGDYTFVINSKNLLNIGLSFTRFSDGSIKPIMTQYKPSDLNLPAYIDTKAGALASIPALTVAGLDASSPTYPSINSGSTGLLKIGMTTIRGAHSFKYGWEERRYWYTSASPGYTSGRFAYDNTYTRQADNTTTASNLALGWAAFMMALPSTISIDTNDSGIFSTRYRALYFQDDWRISSRMHIGFGMRYEREGGITERFNRGLAGGFDFGYRPAFADAAEAAYAKSPIAELSASQFKVLGGSYYLGQQSNTFTDGTHKFLPNVSTVFQVNSKTVVRAGYGWFYDTLSAMNTRPGQNGYSQSTNVTVTSDNGLTFCCGVGAAANLGAKSNPMTDPFPVRADGTRFEVPVGNALGADIRQGLGYTITPRDFVPAFQQRWRLSVQREITKDMVIDVSYNGAFAKTPMTTVLSALPAQYWATGNVRNQAIDDNLNANVANPFNLANMPALKTSAPLLYKYLSTQVPLFTATSVKRNVLLRPYPNMGTLVGVPAGTSGSDFRGKNKYNDLQVQFERRFAGGLRSTLAYTRAYGVTTYFANEFDKEQSWQPNNSVMPHRLAWAVLYELPFGKGRRFISNHPVQHIVGGWQLSSVYQRQSGPATSWGNLFYYGDPNQIASVFNHDAVHSKDIHVWFDPNIRYTGTGAIPSGFTGFEGRTAMQPGTFQVRVFPKMLDSLRADGIRNWDFKLLRKFRVHERLSTTFSVDLLNATNHTNFQAPNMDPTNQNFGRVTAQLGTSRLIQLNLRIEF